MLTKTFELRVRSVEGTTLPPRAPLSSRLIPLREGTCNIRGERSEMSSNHHDEAGPSFSRLSYSYEWRNECRVLSFTANPISECWYFLFRRAPSVLLWVWVQLDESVKSRSTYVAARMAHRLFIYISRFRSGAKMNTPATYCTGPSTRHSTLVESEPTTTALIALEQLSGRRPATVVHRYRFIFRTWSNLTTLRGLVRSQSCLVRRNWTFQKGTTLNKYLNYIENCSSLS